jgi:hypothetical protein
MFVYGNTAKILREVTPIASYINFLHPKCYCFYNTASKFTLSAIEIAVRGKNCGIKYRTVLSAVQKPNSWT